jgi:competence protein ComEC
MRLLHWMVSIALTGQPADATGMDIYFIDVEGGAATLIVGPGKESLLVDSGNPGNRDAERIAAVARDVAELEVINHLVTTHWHVDHYGGIGRLSELVPVEKFYDRDIPESLMEDKQYFPFLIDKYKQLSEGKRTVLKPGDKIPFRATGSKKWEAICLTSAGQVLAAAKNAPPNPVCERAEPRPVDESDNAKSVSLLISFGAFRFLDCGDLTWNVEKELVCPCDSIGKIDVFQVTHHGLDTSNNPVLVETVQPRVAILNNGSRKGATPSVTQTLRRVPGIEAIYQLHRNVTVGDDLNTDAALIANREVECKGEFIRLTVEPEGTSYTVQIGKDGAKRTFRTRTDRQ